MVTAVLNLARKWRSKQFNQVVGQELPVRMLQNSLYVGQIFPVYLFSGQRGCGKTTTARIFASALNCDQLEFFKKDPKHYIIPCLTCASCLAMAAGNHPDFIEIDAASHTGVDNVRQIIDAASLLPVMGSKRVYLIDEAHMLSKAAFNAFLKILEEPPSSVVFMLATTDPEKILDTVRSRCFQLFFTAIKSDPLVEHLKEVCVAENIEFEISALETIVQETQGSARDALNLLEQVRFSSSKVTNDAVLMVLGHLPEALLFDLVQSVIQKNNSSCMEVLSIVHDGSYTPLLIWQKFQELVRALLALKNNVKPCAHYHDKERMLFLAQASSSNDLIKYLQILYDYEMVLLKSTAQEGVLHVMFFTMMGENNQKSLSFTFKEPIVHKELETKNIVELPIVTTTVAQQAEKVFSDLKEEQNVENFTQWRLFSEAIETLSDPLLKSIFKQGSFKSYDQNSHIVTVVFPLATKFYGEWLQETKLIWQPLLQKAFGDHAECAALFEDIKNINMLSHSDDMHEKTNSSVIESHLIKSQSNENTEVKIKHDFVKNREKTVDISDKETWKTANILRDAFGGTITEIE